VCAQYVWSKHEKYPQSGKRGVFAILGGRYSIRCTLFDLGGCDSCLVRRYRVVLVLYNELLSQQQEIHCVWSVVVSPPFFTSSTQICTYG
jgi:hypothetical protein